jgi:hypothetical protein
VHTSQLHAASPPQDVQANAPGVEQVQEEHVQGEQAQDVVGLVWADMRHLAG